MRDDPELGVEDSRARAAADRVKAAEDLARAVTEREAAARERADALRTRTESAVILKIATTDELTGAWTRKFGLEQIGRELERARRTGTKLLLAFVDVDGLKEVNDTQGHQAGDALLHRVGEALRRSVRAYDVIVRYGGDEFLCAMPNLSPSEARARFEKVAEELRNGEGEHSISFGLAEAQADDSLDELTARADADLLGTRSRPYSAPRSAPQSASSTEPAPSQSRRTAPAPPAAEPDITFKAQFRSFVVYVVKRRP
jgi:diguanylate cyclase (GGDEF)-like protein